MIRVSNDSWEEKTEVGLKNQSRKRIVTFAARDLNELGHCGGEFSSLHWT